MRDTGTASDIYTIAGDGSVSFSGDGGPAISAEFQEPQSVAVDGQHHLADTQTTLIPSETGNNRVRVVTAATGTFYGVPMTAGDIYTVAGNGTPGLSGDGRAATRAELDEPAGSAWTRRATCWWPTWATAGSARYPADHAGTARRGAGAGAGDGRASAGMP